MENFRIIKHIADLDKGNNSSIQVNLISWGCLEAKFDIRRWHGLEPGKGICLTREQASQLIEALETEVDNIFY